MDGTLTVPAIDFVAVREELGVAEGDILTAIDKWNSAKQQWAWQVIEKHEEAGRENGELQPGSRDTLLNFKRAGVLLAIITRNSMAAVNDYLTLAGIEFNLVITREFDYLKPDPRVVEHIISRWGFPHREMLIVGDYIHDIECGRRAGIKTCFFENPEARSFAEHADYTVRDFQELEKLVFNNI